MKKPWNLPDLPVYSLATKGDAGFNMNICTYVSAVSMQPKRFMVAAYHGTRSLENMYASEQVVLQLLDASQTGLVRTLGKKSAMRYDKQAWLRKKEVLAEWHDFTVLRDAAAWMLLRKIWHQDAGDHVIFLFDVLKYKVNAADNIMTLNTLRQHKIISI